MKSDTSDFSFDQNDTVPKTSESRILEVLTMGSGLPRFVVQHPKGTAVYSVMQCKKLKIGKFSFSIRLRCLNQSVTTNKCEAGFSLYSNDESIFEFSKKGRASQENWRFRIDNKKLSALNFEKIDITHVDHCCNYKYKETLGEMKYFHEIRQQRIDNPYMKEC